MENKRFLMWTIRSKQLQDPFSTRCTNLLALSHVSSILSSIYFQDETNLDIEVWDWDAAGDDLIGSTSIDLETRLYNPSWKKKKLKPIEYRYLYQLILSIKTTKGHSGILLQVMHKDKLACGLISLPPKKRN